jgi:hypothetical protein
LIWVTGEKRSFVYDANTVEISVLEGGADVPGLESAVTSCLEKIFSTPYGASLLPHALVYFLSYFGS